LRYFAAPFIDIIGCGSAIQASLIAFALHDDSDHANLNPKLQFRYFCSSSFYRLKKMNDDYLTILF
jgi:hypothetical protein